MRMLDLFSGLGGASQAMRERGWEVITVDNNPEFHPDICMDIREFKWTLYKTDLIWASPPCDDFAKYSFPESWACNRGGKKIPDLTLAYETKRIINDSKPRFWVVENVAGAKDFFNEIFGPLQKKVGSRYLWGDFPIFDTNPVYGKWKHPPAKDRKATRAKIPKGISLALAMAIEHELAPRMG